LLKYSLQGCFNFNWFFGHGITGSLLTDQALKKEKPWLTKNEAEEIQKAKNPAVMDLKTQATTATSARAAVRIN